MGHRAVGKQKRELVAADAGGEVVAAAAVANGGADVAQHRIAGGVTGAVVDLLEVVEVDEAERVLARLVLGLAHGFLEGLLEGCPVGQIGEAVVHGRGTGKLAVQRAAVV